MNITPTTHNTRYCSLSKETITTITYEATIGGHYIELVATGSEEDLYVEFFVDDSTTRKDLDCKVAITKYLLAVWKDLSTHHSKFSCDPAGGKKGWRAKLYMKLGFSYNKNTFLYELAL